MDIIGIIDWHTYWPMVMAKATYRGYATSDITDAVDMISVRRTCNVTIY